MKGNYLLFLLIAACSLLLSVGLTLRSRRIVCGGLPGS